MSLIKVNELATLDGAVDQRVNASTGIRIPASAEIKLDGPLRDSTDSIGLSNQYLVSNGSEVVWQSLPQDINVTSDVTFNDITVSGNITVAGTATFPLTAFTTSDLVEGGNLYYTDIRARAALSAQTSGSGDGSLSYNNVSGVLTYAGPTVVDYRTSFSAITFSDSETRFGSLTYNSVAGSYTYTGITDTEIRGLFSVESNEGSPSSLGGLGYDPTEGIVSYIGPTEEEILNLFNADDVAGLPPNGLTYYPATGTYYIDPGAIEPTVIFSGINQSPTTTTGDVADSIQNLHVNNASYQEVSVSTINVSAPSFPNGSATITAPNQVFLQGDRIKLVDTEVDHLDGIYEVLTTDSNGWAGPGNTFTVLTSNVADTGGDVSPTACTAKRVSVFTGDLVVDGSINVNGSKIGLSDLFVGTSLIRLNSDLPDTATPQTDGTDDAVIEVNRGSQLDTALRWNELAKRWQFSNDGVNYNNILLPSETDFGGAEEFGASGDASRYNVLGLADNVDGGNTWKVLTLAPADINKFKINHRVKVFGLSKTDFALTPPNNPAAPSGISAVFETATFNASNKNYYAYAIAQLDMNTGDISGAICQTAGGEIRNIEVSNLNEANYNTISVQRDGVDKAILLYRGIFLDDAGGDADNAISTFPSRANEFELIAVLGPKYFGNNGNDTVTIYKDYGSYDVTVNSDRNDDGSFGPNEIHVPHTASSTAKQGWITAGIRNIDTGANTIELNVSSLYADNPGSVFLYHDDTVPLQNAINDAKNAGRDFLIIPGGTYLISKLLVPNKFTLRGLADATILHRQYWNTEYVDGTDGQGAPIPELDGARSTMIQSADYAGNDLPTPDGMIDVFIGDIILDGSVKYQVLNAPSVTFGPDSNDAMVNGVNSQFLRLSNVKIRKSAGPALYSPGAENLTIDSCTFFDGADVERFETPVLIADEADTTIVTGCVFRDFPGALDFTTTNVLAVNACTIRNCGSGLKIYGSSKTDVLNNLILGPADEYIPVPDFYDSDFNSVNFPIAVGLDNDMPVLQYVLSGSKYNFRSNNTLRRVEVFRATRGVQGEEVVDLSAPLLNAGNDWFQVVDDVPEGEQPTATQVDPALGQTKFRITGGDTVLLNNTYPTTFNAYNIYRAVGTDYVSIGDDLNPILGTGTFNAGIYTVKCNELAHNSVSAGPNGNYIRLIAHSYAPAPSPEFGSRIWKVVAKRFLGATNYELDLESWEENEKGNLRSSQADGNPVTEVGSQPTPGGGYYQIRNKFVIARGILTVSA